jgi:membrane dipeptidase
MFLIDAHLDMAINGVEWNRDYRQPVAAIRADEYGMTDKPDRTRGTVSLPELRRGHIGLVVATQLARVSADASLPGAGFRTPEIAWAVTQAQKAWYDAMVDLGEMVQITDAAQLKQHLALWMDTTVANETKPVGFILSLEGADSLVNLSYLDKAYAYGLRALGPAHYMHGRYAPGTGLTGGLTTMGKDLLREMDALNMILDVTHLTDEGFAEAMHLYKGPVWASHHNCRTLVPRQRQLADDQIKQLIERGAVIGGCMDAWMLHPAFVQRKSDPVALEVKIETVVNHFDHICQIAGNSLHCAIGSDLDGTYGTEHGPMDLDTIADLQLLEGILHRRGYTPEDIENIFYKNWLRFLEKAWN